MAPTPRGDSRGNGSDYVDNTVVSPEPGPQKKPTPMIDYPFAYYLLQIRRDGGAWWNADRIIARFNRAFRPEPAKP